MNIPPFLILADRGLLKAYQIQKTGAGTAVPRLVGSLMLSEPHERYAEKFTDQAGAFPHGGLGAQGNSIAERMTLDAEEEMRTFRRLAAEINTILKKHRPDRWAFAAPSEVNSAILDDVLPEFRKHLALNIPRDLVNIDDTELLSHFETAKAA